MNLIVDSGATKSIWCVSDGTWHREITLPGINFSQADPQKVGEVVYEAIRSVREMQKLSPYAAPPAHSPPSRRRRRHCL